MAWGLIVLSILYQIISWYSFFMLIYCLVGWFIRDRSNKFYRFFAKIAEPPLHPIRLFLRRFEYFRNSPVDFSPLVMFLALQAIVRLMQYVAVYLVS